MMCNPKYHGEVLSNLVQPGNHLCITGSSLVEWSFKQKGSWNYKQYSWTCRLNTNYNLTSACSANYVCQEDETCGMCKYQWRRVSEDSLPPGVNCDTRGKCQCLGNDSPTGPIPQGYCKAINSYYESLCSPLTSTEDDIVAAEKACITTYWFIPWDNWYTMCLDYYSEVKASSDDPTAYPLWCYIRDMNTMIGAQHPLIQIPSLCIWIDWIRPSN